MLPHSRFWLFVLTVVLFLLLTTALCGAAQETVAARSAAVAAPVGAPAVNLSDAPAGEAESTVVGAQLLLHLVAVTLGLRLGMKVFYESAMWRGFMAIILIDTAVVAVMDLVAPLTDGFSAMLGPQVVVTGLVMIVTLRHFGFTKDRFTVIPAVLMAKAIGFFAEVVLRMLFLDVLLRWAAAKGL